MIVITPNPHWIRPVKFPNGKYYGYCSSGPENGLRPPGDDYVPEEIGNDWYWVVDNKDRANIARHKDVSY